MYPAAVFSPLHSGLTSLRNFVPESTMHPFQPSPLGFSFPCVFCHSSISNALSSACLLTTALLWTGVVFSITDLAAKTTICVVVVLYRKRVLDF